MKPAFLSWQHALKRPRTALSTPLFVSRSKLCNIPLSVLIPHCHSTGACVLAIDSIWGPATTAPAPTGNVLPIQWFVKEVLRRSRTSCSTLQVALYYLHQARHSIRAMVAAAALHREEFLCLEGRLAIEQEARSHYPSPPTSPTEEETRFAELLEAQTSPLLCGRRTFLAALISSSKYLQDRNYSNRAWAKISGLPAVEININERAFLSLVDYNLFVSAEDFSKCKYLVGEFQGRLESDGYLYPGTTQLASLASPRMEAMPMPLCPAVISPPTVPRCPSPPTISLRTARQAKSRPSPPEVLATTLSIHANGRRTVTAAEPSTGLPMTRPIRSVPTRRSGRSSSLSSSTTPVVTSAFWGDSSTTYVQAAY